MRSGGRDRLRERVGAEDDHHPERQRHLEARDVGWHAAPEDTQIVSATVTVTVIMSSQSAP